LLTLLALARLGDESMKRRRRRRRRRRRKVDSKQNDE
jgi:hypothetical protein